MKKACLAEFFGTFWLVFGGCGAAVFAGGAIGPVGVSLAFGLSVLAMACAVGHVSGGHFNPAVSVGLLAAGQFPPKQLVPYILAQTIGAIAAATAIYLIYRGAHPVGSLNGFAANGYGQLSPQGYPMLSAILVEFILTCAFLLVILGATDYRAPVGFAPIAIGLCLTLIHLVGIPITNTSVNPARSLSQALFAGPEYLEQVWLFWLAPLAGAITAGLLYRISFITK
ncbi:aquaporin Z [Nitratidesulfovibrio termitidis]|uniref:aquaporin Z n=1 Tax=Nitratidesulfovibrio termitidis TaxID=42252 RepID=UPI0005582886|nr:aquaporin Z [Nitratidesulfovibrio termitidis]